MADVRALSLLKTRPLISHKPHNMMPSEMCVYISQLPTGKEVCSPQEISAQPIKNAVLFASSSLFFFRSAEDL